MSDRNLTVARLVEDHIDGIEVEGSAFADLLNRLGIAPKVESQNGVMNAKVGDKTRVYVCSCAAFKFHELLPRREEIEADNRGMRISAIAGRSVYTV